jgi:hypothetical protein
MSTFFYVVLSCVGRGLQMGRFPLEGVLPKCLNGFRISEVDSELEGRRRPNPCSAPQQPKIEDTDLKMG